MKLDWEIRGITATVGGIFLLGLMIFWLAMGTIDLGFFSGMCLLSLITIIAGIAMFSYARNQRDSP